MQSQIKNNTICERCKQPFICNPTNIAACGCSKVQLSFEETQYISELYSNCVCNTCLLHLKDEFLKLK